LAEVVGGVVQAVEDHFGNLFTLEPGRPVLCLVQISIHPHECLAGADVRWWEAVAGQTAVETPGDEERDVRRLPVGEAAGVEGHMHWCWGKERILKKGKNAPLKGGMAA
jgi:hypothetical protein